MNGNEECLIEKAIKLRMGTNGRINTNKVSRFDGAKEEVFKLKLARVGPAVKNS